ncbi:MAG: alpha/beta hydrolase [Clostridia bacterium]|nr:alpha/beta hydrolase [Clostridia bacterium]
MIKCIKAGLIAAGAAAGLAYGLSTVANECLFNRKIVFPDEFNHKMSGCDNSHLGEFLQNNLKWLESYGYEKHYLTSDKGYILTGYLVRPEKESDVYVFGAHGYRSHGKKEFSKFVQYYIEKGYNVFFPDHVASGESEGLMCTFGYNEREDCMKWLGYLIGNFGKDIKIILHGVSMGCATVCMMSGREDLPSNVKFTVADCGFTQAEEFFNWKTGKLGIKGAKYITKGVFLAGKINHGFDLFDVSPVDCVKKARVPMFFVHGDKDGLVPSFMCHELYESCGSEMKDILIVPDADHAQAFVKAKDAYAEKIEKFAAHFGL